MHLYVLHILLKHTFLFIWHRCYMTTIKYYIVTAYIVSSSSSSSSSSVDSRGGHDNCNNSNHCTLSPSCCGIKRPCTPIDVTLAPSLSLVRRDPATHRSPPSRASFFSPAGGRFFHNLCPSFPHVFSWNRSSLMLAVDRSRSMYTKEH